MSMSELSAYEQTVVGSWTDMHKKSALMLLILLGLSQQSMWMGQVKSLLEGVSDGHLGVDDQSLHRALRRLEGLNLIVHSETPAPGSGLKRKMYELTQSGERVLTACLTDTLSYTRNPQYLDLVDSHLASIASSKEP
jgi:DNA-binding PadR family transcriptional regulator